MNACMKCMKEWTNEWMNEQTKVRRPNECMNKCVREWMNAHAGHVLWLRLPVGCGQAVSGQHWGSPQEFLCSGTNNVRVRVCSLLIHTHVYPKGQVHAALSSCHMRSCFGSQHTRSNVFVTVTVRFSILMQASWLHVCSAGLTWVLLSPIVCFLFAFHPGNFRFSGFHLFAL